jgi:hypothetical protein
VVVERGCDFDDSTQIFGHAARRAAVGLVAAAQLSVTEMSHKRLRLIV